MVLIVQRGLNRQNNHYLIKNTRTKKKMWPNGLNEFPKYTTTSLVYFLLTIIMVIFVFADWP